MAEEKVLDKEPKDTVSINGKDIVNDHVSNIKIKNIFEETIIFESGAIAPNELGTATAAEAEALFDYVQKV
jgi:hypothetical protein